MKLRFQAVLMFSVFMVSGISVAGQDDVYLANAKTKSLNVTWAGGSRTIENVVGSEGETTRELVDFNGGKALHYENLASRSTFEAYFTLMRNAKDVFIDCIYANVRNEQNGILINKAVCGLNRPLAEEYDEAIYEFSDEWKSSTDNIAIEPLLRVPPLPLEVSESTLGEAKLSRIYNSKDNLSVSAPEAVIEKGTGKHSFGSSQVFSVYKVGDLARPIYFDVSSGALGGVFTRYDQVAIDKLF
ncbi:MULTISPECIES: hypothetical protein [Pseudomonas]|uniref:Uncharacterized protein n=1 Tax=Pseudomonas fluorescens TaxID=294 RepID=A0A5E6W0S4_PSEFL|nr:MULTISPECIES: hypothetical protein [Pseudomonas]VVN22288.1 hypothetical protein PS624_04401 [Pseudomonas fluorescens]